VSKPTAGEMSPSIQLLPAGSGLTRRYALVASLRTIWIAAASLILCACAACPRGEHPADLSIGEAIGLANASAIREGYDLSLYHPPKAHYEFVQKDCSWAVFYDSTSNNMPGHFSVYINDLTQRAIVVGGL